ncbi:hypothetical protein Tco_0676561 [Tanacetum coccineum]
MKMEYLLMSIPLALCIQALLLQGSLKEGRSANNQIIRVDGSSKRYSAFIQMLKSFDKEDLETLWKLVKAKHGSIRLEEGYDRVLSGDLKTIFEHHVEDLGRIIGIKRLLDDLRVTVAQVRVTAAKHILVLWALLHHHSSEYVAPPSIDVVRQWFPMIGYKEEVLAKGTLRKILLPPRWSVNNWGLKPNQPEEPPFTYHKLAICAADKLVVFKAPKTSSKSESVSQGTKPGAQTGHKKPLTSLKQPSGSRKEATKGVTSEEKANPQLSSGMSAFNLNKPIFSASFSIYSEFASGCDYLVDFITEADPGLSAPNDSIPQQQGMDEGTKNTSYDHIFAGTDPHVLADQTKSVSKGLETVLTQPITGKGARSIARQVKEEEASGIIKLEDLAKLVLNIEPIFKDLDSPEDDHVITVDDSDEDEEDVHTTPNVLIFQSQMHKLKAEKNKAKAEVALLKAQPFFPNVSLPTELKDLPSKFHDLTEETITSLTSQVAELKTLQWELPAKFLVVPSQVEMVKAKLKTLDSLPCLLNKVTNALNQFAQTITSKKIRGDSVPLASQVGTQLAEGKDKGKKALSSEEAIKESTESDSDDDETHLSGSMVKSSRIKKVKKFNFVTEDGKHIHLTKEQINQQKKIQEEAKAEAVKHESEVRKEELIDLLSPDVVNKRAESRITNCDVLTKKGPITLKVYREDGTSEVISNFKASDLHLGEWREVVKACPNRTGKGWQTSYDPLDKLNDLANKKRKHADDIHDYFKANKRLKSSVQYEDHLPGTVLNEPVLGMIVFNSYHRQDFVTVEDFRDFPNTMLYTVQEIFFRLHQGPGLDDHARTISSLLLAEVDKRNLNPLKQMRTIEQLRQ